MPLTGDRKREYQRDWMRANRKAWLAENGPCVSCGSAADLEVDHVDRSTKVASWVWSWSVARRTEELAKCQVLCRSCHRSKSEAEGFPQAPVHGSRNRYEKGCRCDPCRASNATHARRVREARRARAA